MFITFKKKPPESITSSLHKPPEADFIYDDNDFAIEGGFDTPVAIDPVHVSEATASEVVEESLADITSWANEFNEKPIPKVLGDLEDIPDNVNHIELICNELLFDKQSHNKLSMLVAENLTKKVLSTKYPAINVKTNDKRLNRINDAIRPIIAEEIAEYIRELMR